MVASLFSVCILNIQKCWKFPWWWVHNTVTVIYTVKVSTDFTNSGEFEWWTRPRVLRQRYKTLNFLESGRSFSEYLEEEEKSGKISSDTIQCLSL